MKKSIVVVALCVVHCAYGMRKEHSDKKIGVVQLVITQETRDRLEKLKEEFPHYATLGIQRIFEKASVDLPAHPKKSVYELYTLLRDAVKGGNDQAGSSLSHFCKLFRIPIQKIKQKNHAILKISSAMKARMRTSQFSGSTCDHHRDESKHRLEVSLLADHTESLVESESTHELSDEMPENMLSLFGVGIENYFSEDETTDDFLSSSKEDGDGGLESDEEEPVIEKSPVVSRKPHQKNVLTKIVLFFQDCTRRNRYALK